MANDGSVKMVPIGEKNERLDPRTVELLRDAVDRRLARGQSGSASKSGSGSAQRLSWWGVMVATGFIIVLLIVITAFVMRGDTSLSTAMPAVVGAVILLVLVATIATRRMGSSFRVPQQPLIILLVLVALGTAVFAFVTWDDVNGWMKHQLDVVKARFEGAAAEHLASEQRSQEASEKAKRRRAIAEVQRDFDSRTADLGGRRVALEPDVWTEWFPAENLKRWETPDGLLSFECDRGHRSDLPVEDRHALSRCPHKEIRVASLKGGMLIMH